MAIKLLKASPRVPQPDPLAFPRCRRLGQSRTVVTNGQNQLIAAAARCDLEMPGTVRSGHAVLESIFHDRLQNEVGNQSLQHVRLDGRIDAKRSLKADLHDLEVATQKVELVSNRYFVRAVTVDGVSKQLT